MKRLVLQNIKPAQGVAPLVHRGLVLILPLVVFVLVRLEPRFVPLALSVVVLSKWRMLAVRPRFWAANVRANAIDLMVGLSIVLFMTHSGSAALQALWAVLYAVWLLGIKPKAGIAWVTLQAGLGQLAALSALYLVAADRPTAVLTLGSGLFCFLAARHFLDTFDEPHARLLAYIWGYFGAALAWVLSHWLLFYHGVAQPTLLLSTLGYGLAVLYYLDHQDRLSKNLQRQIVLTLVAIVLIVLRFSDWGDKVV